MAGPDNFVFDYLKDSNGSVDMTVNGSSTAVAFGYTVPDGEWLELYKITITIVDGGIDWGVFGGLVSALSTGLHIHLLDAEDNVLLDVTNSENIKQNEDFTFVAGGDVIAQKSSGDDILVADIALAEISGREMILEPGGEVQVEVHDDLTGLSYMRSSIHGFLVRDPSLIIHP